MTALSTGATGAADRIVPIWRPLLSVTGRAEIKNVSAPARARLKTSLLAALRSGSIVVSEVAAIERRSSREAETARG